MNNRHNIIGIPFLLTASLIWGTAYIPTRYLANQHVSVFLELLIRYSVPLFFLGIIYFKKICSTSIDIIKKCMFTGIILFLSIMCSIYGIRITQYGSIGILLLSLNTVFIPLYFVIFHRQKIASVLILASLLSFIGTIILTFGSTNNTINSGALLCLIASLGYSAYIILWSKTLKTDLHAGVAQFFQAVPFVLLCLPIVLLNFNSLSDINWNNNYLWYSFFYVGIFAGTLGYQFYFYGQKFSHPIVTSLILASQTIFSSLADFFLFKIELSNIQIIAYMCIITAVLLSPFRNQQSQN